MADNGKKSFVQCLQDYNKKVLQSAVGSVAAVSPPSSYKAAAKAKDSTNAQKTKAAIKAMQARILSTWNNPVMAAPAGRNSIYHTGKGSTPKMGLYVLDKGKGKRKPNATNLPILSSASAVKDWYLQHTTLRRGKRGYYRALYRGAVAFVSSGSILRQAGKEISKSVGKFIGGWWTLFDLLGKRITRFTTATAASKATGKSSASKNNVSITATNSATDIQGVATYAENLIAQHLPKSIDYYSKIYEKYLAKDVEKNIGIKNLTLKLNIK